MPSALPRREPGKELAELVPDPAEPGPVNLFGGPSGEDMQRRFNPDRLARFIASGPMDGAA
ncbi:hypothetical protein [Streptomyces sp. WM6378]|uniref:hypothetical protein n=1 Tax=Streptomyces sp. WM6378 TaxID=1415557 RepID=UPI0006AECB1B|nr:hypothetical protein [Streptomyces sp. WM6378]KOU53984.1 hypothetical protein ADK54_02780 [Streptomyces sp. WM6378]